jgi:hypothetical protein
MNILLWGFWQSLQAYLFLSGNENDSYHEAGEQTLKPFVYNAAKDDG